MHPARGRHRLAPQLTTLRPLRRRTTGVAQKATPGVGCSLDPSPAAPSPGRLTAHGALGCSPPPPRVPRRHACPCLDALCASRARVSGTDGAATAPAVAAPSVPETCALVQGACQEGGKRGGAGRAAAAASSRALRAQWGGRARAQRVTGQGSSPHPAVAFERRLSHACAGAAGRSAVGRDGAVPAAGRVQGAGAENPAHSAPAEAADRVESFSWPRGPPLCSLCGKWEIYLFDTSSKCLVAR